MSPARRSRRFVAGALAVAFYLAHGSWHLAHGFAENLLWSCHLGSLLVGVGLLARAPHVHAVGVLWLLLGTPLWLVGLACGGRFVPTSTLTHLGGLAVGLWGVRELGLPRGAWWRALAALVVAHLLSRALGPPGKNVNLAREVWTGFDRWFTSHTAFVLVVGALAAAIFVGGERLLRRALARER